ncbi:MAG: autotransporter domain-containing protein [Hyphomicrobiales bacterium]|nr:autotransporter domain-containing protein [Hyphomicrobiales bacterium]MDE2114418.1 autotransporter domain-containing protein [Hyphomicrobiales bacterium]
MAWFAGTAAAQSYNRVISFGDSLTDNGNLFATTGQPPFPYNKRFTNGFTFAEYLAGSPVLGGPSTQTGFLTTGPGSVNYAFGGARNDNGANTNGPIPSTITQITTFSGLGGTYGPNDLVTYWAGANNLFQATIPGATQATIQAAAVSSGLQSGAQVGNIAALGAKTIVIMNLPNFGLLPVYTAQGPLGIATGSFASTTFDLTQSQAVQAAAAAHPGTNFIQVDAASAVASVIANPAAFGFTNATAGCVTTLACVTAPFATQNQFFFWDTVHPTDAGHRLLAAVISDYIYAPTRTAAVAALGDTSFWSRRATTLDMLDRARAGAPSGEAIQFFAALAGLGQSSAMTSLVQPSIGTATSLQTTTQNFYQGGLRFGGFKNLGYGWTGGVEISALTGHLSAGTIAADPTSISLDVTAGWRQGPLFTTLQAGGGIDFYNQYRRQMTVSNFNQTGSTNGQSGSLSLEGGYDIGLGRFTLTPVARLGYLYTNVAGFNEQGTLASVNFSNRTVQGLTGAAELRGRFAVSSNLGLSGEIGYENFLTKSIGALRGQLANNTALPFASTDSGLVGAGVTFGLGLDGHFGAWTASAAWRGTAGAHAQVLNQGNIQISRLF